MTEYAAPARASHPHRFPLYRRWDIDQAILRLLESSPKTAAQLFRMLNPGMQRAWALTARGWKRRLLGVHVDKRVLVRHLHYLLRDGLIVAHAQLKILDRDQSSTSWLIKYYLLRKSETYPPPPYSLHGRPYHVSKIHNPFKGEEGMLRFIRWLRDS